MQSSELWKNNEAGQSDEAYDVLRSVSLEAIECPCCLRRMSAIFDQAGDVTRRNACAARMADSEETGEHTTFDKRH
jgi:hypothetical protein